MNSDCEMIRNAIADLVTGVLPDAEAEMALAHIRACPACREYAEALHEEDSLLDGFVSTFDADMSRREQQVIGALSRFDATSSGVGFRFLKTQIKNALSKQAAAAAVIVVVGLYFVITFSWVSQITAVIRHGL